MTNRRQVVTDFFRLITEGRPKDALKYFTADCVQHNPYVNGDMDALFDSMIEAMKSMPREYPDPELRVRYIVEEGDMVAAYTQLLASKSDPAKGGLRQVHLFRFRDDRVCEYWDITQMINEEMPHPGNAF